MKPHKGAIARCSLGAVGLITSREPQRIKYGDGKEGVAWTGIQLSEKLSSIGSPWSSRNPKVIGEITSNGHVILFEGNILKAK